MAVIAVIGVLAIGAGVAWLVIGSVPLAILSWFFGGAILAAACGIGIPYARQGLYWIQVDANGLEGTNWFGQRVSFRWDELTSPAATRADDKRGLVLRIKAGGRRYTIFQQERAWPEAARFVLAELERRGIEPRPVEERPTKGGT